MVGIRSPFHFGGPLGLAGLALLAGATGLFVLAGSPENDDQPSVTLSGVSDAVPASLPDTRVDRDAGSPTDALQDVPAPLDTEEAPLSGETIIQPAQVPKSVITAQATGVEVTFIVRIKGSPEIDSVGRLYKKDPAAAEQAFADYVQRTPALRDFVLVGASYSGEIRLAYQMPPGVEPTRAAIRSVQERIMAVDGVAYADPDYIAQPGKED
ncbi:hypothetical protein [Hyphomonas sp.]|uniref:hypothetical protein n=1 Tax=Hyphomonas sp. TaxID=87 RepID=UPI0030F8D610